MMICANMIGVLYICICRKKKELWPFFGGSSFFAHPLCTQKKQEILIMLKDHENDMVNINQNPVFS